MAKPFYFSMCLIWMALFSCMPLAASPLFEATKSLPVAYQGRFRPAESASRLWLHEFYHRERLKQEDLMAFHTENSSALDLLWRLHFFGHGPFDSAPFFWVHYAALKTVLKQDLAITHFSFKTLYKALYENQEINREAMKLLILSELASKIGNSPQRTANEKIELDTLSPGLWLALRHNKIVLLKSPKNPPWHFLKEGMTIAENAKEAFSKVSNSENGAAQELKQLFQMLSFFISYDGASNSFEKAYEEEYAHLKDTGSPPAEIARVLEARLPFEERMSSAGATLLMLPSKNSPGEWVSLHAFHLKTYDPKNDQFALSDNFTPFPNEQFDLLRSAYLDLENTVLSQKSHEEVRRAAVRFAVEYEAAYESLSGQPFKSAHGKSLNYPTEFTLQAETFYTRLPLVEAALCGYAFALIFMLIGKLQNRKSRVALFFTLTAFAIHTAILAIRCFILERPPVSNMFETVVYVPWIAVALGLAFYSRTQSKAVLASAIFASLTLLVLLKLTQSDSKLENVQAVLDSQYWLIIHVLMVVGSYGAFAVCGILGHFYLLGNASGRLGKDALERIAKGILHTMYIGMGLLIPGTILGGIWAAESWGRFWDWDPKESWAFISACIYLVFIHAYTFHRIRDFGLAVGAVTGLLAISFTWYGVNYVLGTGLHSYGFGSGGELYYYAYLVAEGLFIAVVTSFRRRYS